MTAHDELRERVYSRYADYVITPEVIICILRLVADEVGKLKRPEHIPGNVEYNGAIQDVIDLLTGGGKK